MLPTLPTGGFVLVALGGLWLCLWRTRWRLLGLAAIAAGLATFVVVRTPDILVNGQGSLIAIRGEDGRLALSSTRVARYEGKTWLRNFGQRVAAPWPSEGFSNDRRFACDHLGCIVRSNGRTVAIAIEAAALEEDCRTAWLLVSVVRVRRALCRGPAQLIDRLDLWRYGTHAIWLNGDGIRVRSVGQTRGDRPWTPGRARRRQR